MFVLQRDLQSFQLWLTGAKEQLNIPPINVSGASIEDNININKVGSLPNYSKMTCIVFKTKICKGIIIATLVET